MRPQSCTSTPSIGGNAGGHAHLVHDRAPIQNTYTATQLVDRLGVPDPTTVIQNNQASTSNDNVGLVGPALNIGYQADNSVAMSWPDWATGFTLQSDPSLPSTNWVIIPGVQTNRAVIQPADPKQFDRLEKQ